MPITDRDLVHLRRAVELAREGLEAGDEPFGSVLVDAAGTSIREDRNRVGGGDETLHPEFELARWAANNLTPDDRAVAAVYTSGEHCPMCSAAHAWVGLGRIVYASSSAQTAEWRASLGMAAGPVAALPINAVAPGIEVDGPAPEFADELKAMFASVAERARG